MTPPSASSAREPLPVRDDSVPSWQLLLTLTAAGAIAGLAVVTLYDWTRPRVEAHKAAVLREAIEEVLHAPRRADTLWLRNGKLSASRPTGDDTKKAERVYLGYDAADKPIGYALQVVEPGFADPITLLIGYDATRRELLGMKVLDSKETPGIADKIVLPVFTSQFRGRTAPLTGIKRDERARMATDRSAVVMITGATISSRAVVRGINKTIAHWHPYLDAFRPAGASPHDTLGAGGNR
jgi:H+/Na+-translocating ferredoxin:NAD+ oxidoreductase subunit G